MLTGAHTPTNTLCAIYNPDVDKGHGLQQRKTATLVRETWQACCFGIESGSEGVPAQTVSFGEDEEVVSSSSNFCPTSLNPFTAAGVHTVVSLLFLSTDCKAVLVLLFCCF